MSNENDLITWKRNYHTSWINTGIPFIHDLTTGYDAHVVFPLSPVYGNTQSWRDLQTQAINDLGSQSFTFNAWNGFTEGMAAMPTAQYGEGTYDWLTKLYGGNDTVSNTSIRRNIHEEHLKFFPNPVIDHAEIRLTNLREHLVSYEIVNNEGFISQCRNLSHFNDLVSSFELHLGDLSPGLYLLVVHTDRSTFTTKIVRSELE